MIFPVRVGRLHPAIAKNHQCTSRKGRKQASKENQLDGVKLGSDVFYNGVENGKNQHCENNKANSAFCRHMSSLWHGTLFWLQVFPVSKQIFCLLSRGYEKPLKADMLFIHGILFTPSLRAERSNPGQHQHCLLWIASTHLGPCNDANILNVLDLKNLSNMKKENIIFSTILFKLFLDNQKLKPAFFFVFKVMADLLQLSDCSFKPFGISLIIRSIGKNLL